MTHTTRNGITTFTLGVLCLLCSTAFAQTQQGCDETGAQSQTGTLVSTVGAIDPCAKLHPVRSTNSARALGRYWLPGRHDASDSFPHGYGFNVLSLGSKSVYIADHLYPVGESGELGLRGLVVSDGPGRSGQVDEQLGKAPFALIEHQLHHGPAVTLGRYLMSQMRDALGAYVGDGRTIHSPASYHNGTWGVKGYPARVYAVHLKGEPDDQVATNLTNVSRLLGEISVFPGNFDRPVKYPTFLDQLQAYRAWLLDGKKPVIGGNEMSALILNLGMNIPHNVASYEAIWPGEGQKMFNAASAKGFQETHFEPLWKKMGYTSSPKGLLLASGDAGPLALAPIDAETFVDATLRRVLTPAERLASANKLLTDAGLTPAKSLCDARFKSAWKLAVSETADKIRITDEATPFRHGPAFPDSILSMTEDGTIAGNPYVTLDTVGTAIDESDTIKLSERI